MLPRISLVTPSYNQAAFLEATIQSVLAQNYPNLEYMVFDGGSTDGSVEILRRYENHFAYWTSERDAGQSDALNRGFARATGEIFGWLNSDDVLLPNALQTIGAYFAQHRECDFVAGDGIFINADGSRELFYVRAAAYTFRDLLHYDADKYLPQPSVFFTRRAFAAVGGLDVSLRYGMDLDLWLRMRRQFELHYIPNCLAQMRLHGDAKSQHAEHAALRAVMHVIARHWGRESVRERAQLFWGLRAMMAREMCAEGLKRAQQRDSRAGWNALRDAMLWNPSVLFSRVARQLLARLLLPRSAQNKILRAP